MTGSRARQALAPLLLEEAAALIGDVADRQRTKVALVGGFALQYFGSPRLTGDVDVVAASALEGLEPTHKLSFGGQKTTVLSKGHPTVGTNVLVPVDVIVRNDDFADLYAAALDHTVDKGAPLPIVEPEYIALMKMEARRRKDEDDLVFLIAHDVLDIEKTERLVRKYFGAYAIRDFRSYIREARWNAED